MIKFYISYRCNCREDGKICDSRDFSDDDKFCDIGKTIKNNDSCSDKKDKSLIRDSSNCTECFINIVNAFNVLIY